jgi:hypothetical protein
VVPRREPRQHTNPFVEKKAHRRHRSRARAIAHVRVPLSQALRTPRRARPMPAWQESERVVVTRQAPQPKVETPAPKETPKGPPPRVVGRAAALADEFEPATRNGAPIPYSLKYTISFGLKDE